MSSNSDISLELNSRTRADLRTDFNEIYFLATSLLKRLDQFSNELSMLDGISAQAGELESGLLQVILNKLNSVKSTAKVSLDALGDIGSSREIEDYLAEKKQLQEALRILYRNSGALICSNEWQSPSFGSPVVKRLGRDRDVITDRGYDYKPDRHMDALRMENKFLENYLGFQESGKAQAFFTPSGTSAYASVLNYLQMWKGIRSNALMIGKSYFATREITQRAFGSELAIIDGSNTDLIIEKIKELKPSVIFCEPLSNTANLDCVDILNIIDFLADSYEHEVCLVVDSVCTPGLFRGCTHIKNPPNHLTFFITESLIKYFQYGMDIVGAGVIIVSGNDPAFENFWRVRARLGVVLGDTSVCMLPELHWPIFDERLKRFERNAMALAESLVSYQKNFQTPILKKVIYPGLNDCSQLESAKRLPFKGSILNLAFNEEYESVEFFRFFNSVLFTNAKRLGADINFSTSTGFNNTRIYITDVNSPKAEPFLRVSVGTETAIEMQKIEQVFIQAFEEVVELLKDRELCDQVTSQAVTFRAMQQAKGICARAV